MAKKITKKTKPKVVRAPRMTSALRTIQEGEEFVRRLHRGLRGTRTMRDIVGGKSSRPVPRGASIRGPRKVLTKRISKA